MSYAATVLVRTPAGLVSFRIGSQRCCSVKDPNNLRHLGATGSAANLKLFGQLCEHLLGQLGQAHRNAAGSVEALP